MAFQDMTFGDWVLMVICLAIATALLACWSRSVAGGWPWTPDDVQPESFSEELRELVRVKLSKIARVERRYIDRAEEHVRAYAEALADANVITDDERDELYERAKQAAEDAVRAYNSGEQAAAVAKHPDSERYTAGLAFVASGGLDPDGHENETNAPYYFGHSAIQAFEAGAVWQAKRSTEKK